MYVSKIFFSICVLLLGVSQLFAQVVSVENTEDKVLPEVPSEYHNISREWRLDQLGPPWDTQDDNRDGNIDSARIFRGSQKSYVKQREVIDTNNDGFINDFAFFNAQGEIIYQEIDTNGDQKIDYWVEISQGDKILRIQRDVDYDGYVDKDYNFKERQQ